MIKLKNAIPVCLAAAVCMLTTGFAAAQTSLSTTSLSFGSRAVGTTGTLPVVLTNTGTANLTVSSIGNSGANPTAFSHTSNCGGVSIAPNGTCTIQVSFTPSAIGSYTASLNIADSASNSPQSVALSGTGANLPVVTLSPASLSFPATEVATTATLPVTLTNTGQTNLTVTAIANGGANPANFTHTSNCGGVSIAPNGTCTIQISFTPSATGSFTAALNITDNAGNSPQSLVVSGTGANLPAVKLSATSVSFPATELGATSTIPVTLTNTGTANLTVTAIANSGTNPSNFSHTSNCGGVSIAPSGTCTIQVKFTPSGVGSFSAAMNITDNATNSPQSITVSGTGANPPTVSLSATSLSFPSTAVGSTAVLPVTLTNTGLGNLTVTAIGNTGANPTDFSHTSNCGGVTIAPNGTCTIQVKFTPAATGSFAATLSVTDNAGNSPQSIALSGTGMNSTAVSLSATSLSFAALPVGSSSTLPVTLTNTGSGNLNVTAIGNSGANPTDFSHTSNCGGVSIVPSGTCTIQVTFTPAAAGTFSASLNITDNAGNSPQSIALSGTGANPAAVSLSSTSLSFPSTTVGATATLPVTVTNSGSGNLTVTAIGNVGTNPTDFSHTSNCGGVSIVPNGTCTIQVKFAPPSTGSFSATLQITDNATGSPQSVFLSGAGVSPTPLTLQASGSLPTATTNVAYGGAISASGGSGAGYVFTVNGTQVPITGAAVLISNGISVSSAGGNTLGISGTPTTTSTVTLSNVTVKDSANNTAGPDTYTIAVNQPGYQVSGHIGLYINCAGPGTLPTYTVSINTNPVQTTTTDSSGNYSFSGIPNGTYTITPSIVGPSSVFSPSAQTGVVVSNNSVSAQNFVSALGYTVSGTVNYGGTAKGQVYLSLNSNNCGGNNSTGTSITEATLKSGGAFTIRGVPPGAYTLASWMDNLGYGAPNASNPSGSAGGITISNANLTGVSISLADPSAVTLGAGPSLQSVSPFSQGVVVPFKGIQNNGVEVATSYTLEWSTNSGFTSIAGQTSFAATGTNGSNVWFVNVNNVTGLSAGSAYYFRAQGVAGTSTSNWSSIVGPVTIAAPTVGATVNGTVNFSGTATGPLYVGFYDQNTNNVYATVVGSQANPPTNGAAYTVQVPAGSNYINFGIVDQNNDGLVGPGDINNVNGAGHQSTVTIPATGPVTEPTLALPSQNSTVQVATQSHSQTNQNGTYNSYSLEFNVTGVVKLPVAVALVSATNPDTVIPVDLANCDGCGNGPFSYSAYLPGYTPNLGDSYGLQITYSDATQETLPVTVSTVLGAFASNLTPNLTSGGVSLTPTFTWTDPANAASYQYSFTLWDSNSSTIWQIPGNNSNSNGFSSAITSIAWGTDPTGGGSTPTVASLSNGETYTWQIQVQDSIGNAAQTQVSFTTPEAPLTLPAAGTNPLGSALVGEPYAGAVTASGGSGSGYSFTVNGNTVPNNGTPLPLTNGLTAINAGTNRLFIIGTPLAANSVSLSVSVEDGQANSAGPVTYTLPVSSGPNGANNSYLSGQYVCELGGYVDSNGTRWASLFSLFANGSSGTFTNGIFDSNGNGYANALTGTVSGTYSVGSDNNGLATFTTSVPTVGGSSVSQWAIALTNYAGPTAAEFEMVEVDDSGTSPSGHHGTGECYLAAPSAFTAGTISGHGFAYQISGEDSGGGPRINVGRFNASSGNITGGYLDQVSGLPATYGNTSFTGSYTLPASPGFASYGRFTLAIGNTSSSVNYAVYVIDPNRMFMLETDPGNGTAAGQIRTQQQTSYSGANLNSSFVLYAQGFNFSGNVLTGTYSWLGQGAGNAAGNLTFNESYNDNNGTYVAGYENGGPLAVTFDSANPGRATMNPGGGTDTIYLYLFDNNTGFEMNVNTGKNVDAGRIDAQTQSSFSNAAEAGNYMLGGFPPELPTADSDIGEATLLNTGNITANVSAGGEGEFSFDQAQTGLTVSWLSTTYGTFSFADSVGNSSSCIVISSSRTVCISNTSSSPSVEILQQ